MPEVIVVPPSGTPDEYLRVMNLWGHQWAGHQRNRRLVEIGGDSPEAVVDAAQTAATQAGRRGKIIFCCHGAVDETVDRDPSQGRIIFLANDKFTITNYLAFSVFGPVRNSQRGRVSIQNMITAANEWAGLSREDRARRMAEGGRQGLHCGRFNRSELCMDPTLERDLLNVARLRENYTALCNVFRGAPVDGITLAACNIGNAYSFLNEISTDFNIRVTAYTRTTIASSRIRNGPPRSERVRLFLQGDARGSGTNNRNADTELMSGASADDVRIGRILPPPLSDADLGGTLNLDVVN